MTRCIHCDELFVWEGSEYQGNHHCGTCGEMIEECQQIGKELDIKVEIPTVEGADYVAGFAMFDYLIDLYDHLFRIGQIMKRL